MKTYKGLFKPQNPKKYLGDHKNIIFRSSYEAKLMKYLDEHPDVVSWASEEIAIPYISPVDGKQHRYFPDFYVKRRSKNGIIENVLIEVKPLAQTRLPETKNSRLTKRLIEETARYAINQEKWKAAQYFCESHGWKFMIMTEKELGVK